MSIRSTLKAGIFGGCLLLAAPSIAIAWLEKRLGSGEAWFGLFAQLFAIVPGAPGLYLRSAYYFGTLDNAHWEVHLGFGTLCTHRGTELARNVSTGAYCVIGHAAVGEGVRIASRVSIPSGKRQHLDEQGALAAGTRFDRVHIGRGAWIGEGAVVMADVGAECIVSAGAIVVNALPGSCIAGGNPAKVLRELPAAGAIAGER